MHYNFDIDVKDGDAGENKLKKILASKKIEVKTDFLALTTRNVAVEYESWNRPAGIATTEADWWAFYIPRLKVITLIETEKLKQLARKHFYDKRRRVTGGDNNNAKMILIPLVELLEAL